MLINFKPGLPASGALFCFAKPRPNAERPPAMLAHFAALA